MAKPREQNARFARLLSHVASILVEAPEELFNKVGTAVAGFVNRTAEDYGTERETEVRELWTKAWTGKGQSEPQTVDIGEPLTEALNHPAGKLAEAALTRLRKYEPRTGEGIPTGVRPYFEAISKDRDGQLGRVMLATRLYYLFVIDPDWATEHIIVRLSPGQSQEAANLGLLTDGRRGSARTF